MQTENAWINLLKVKLVLLLAEIWNKLLQKVPST